jgi:hypothetical protein
MNKISPILERRFALRRTQYLCERFEKSPNLTQEYSAAAHLGICYSIGDASIISTLSEIFRKMYLYVRNWYGYQGHLPIRIWVASSPEDMEFMTCIPYSEGYAYAPGIKNGANVILIDSPSLGGRNSDPDRLPSVLLHEISHHFVREISCSTPYTMKRKANLDVPMWLEEGLSTVIMAEVDASFRTKIVEDIAQTTEWDPLEDIWNDLACSQDANRAHLQAYKETTSLFELLGKVEIIRLLHLNRTHHINWNELPEGKKVRSKARYVGV